MGIMEEKANMDEKAMAKTEENTATTEGLQKANLEGLQKNKTMV